jgi:DNA primase
MYNFNSIQEDPFINYQFIISKVSEDQIYEHYLKEAVDLGKSYYSPFGNEKTPSFRLYVKNNRILFKCFHSGYQGDCFEFVTLLYGIPKKQVFLQVAGDLGLINNAALSRVNINQEKLLMSRQSSKIDVVLRKFKTQDYNYWKQFGINEEQLEEYDIKVCQEVWLNDKFLWEYSLRNPIYRYKFGDKYKCYRPLEKDKKKKWISNTTSKTLQGFRQLPEKGENLIITKSYKDVICMGRLGFPSVALSSEQSYISEEFVTYFKGRFQNIIIFYDNDEPGIKAGIARSMDTGLPFTYIPQKFSFENNIVKDLSDFIKIYGLERAEAVKRIIQSTIDNSKHFSINKKT